MQDEKLLNYLFIFFFSLMIVSCGSDETGVVESQPSTDNASDDEAGENIDCEKSSNYLIPQITQTSISNDSDINFTIIWTSPREVDTFLGSFNS